jgi:ATP-dependent exoDNAse (exonuclease V) beta subunit
MASVKPGLHRAQAGNAVVWWDPSALNLAEPELADISHYDILRPDRDPAAAAESTAAHAAWAAARAAALEAGAVPSLSVVTATGLARAMTDSADTARTVDPDAVEVVSIKPEASHGRPSGKRFGTLVHATMAVVDLSASRTQVALVVDAQSRMIGASERERAAAIDAVVAALAHPIVRRAAECEGSSLRRETPVLLTLSDGRLVEGVVDLAYREAERAARTVVDFKTHRQAELGLPEMRAQVALYLRGITSATGEAAQGVLMLM